MTPPGHSKKPAPVFLAGLRVIGDPPPPGWVPIAMPPGMKRSDCPPRSRANPCRYVCRHNGALVEASARPGRRGSGRRLPDPAINFVAAVCSLDVADASAAGLSAAACAKLLGGCTTRRIEQLTRQALAKLKAAHIETHEYLEAMEGSR